MKSIFIGKPNEKANSVISLSSTYTIYQTLKEIWLHFHFILEEKFGGLGFLIIVFVAQLILSLALHNNHCFDLSGVNSSKLFLWCICLFFKHIWLIWYLYPHRREFDLDLIYFLKKKKKSISSPHFI